MLAFFAVPLAEADGCLAWRCCVELRMHNGCCVPACISSRPCAVDLALVAPEGSPNVAQSWVQMQLLQAAGILGLPLAQVDGCPPFSISVPRRALLCC